MALRSCLEGKACVLGREKFHGSRQWSVMFIDLPGRICCWHLLPEEKTSDRVRGFFLLLKNIHLLPQDERRNTSLVTCSCSTWDDLKEDKFFLRTWLSFYPLALVKSNLQQILPFSFALGFHSVTSHFLLSHQCIGQ